MDSRWRQIALAGGVALGACNMVSGADLVEFDNNLGGGAGQTGPQYLAADGVFINSIALYQAVKRPLMENGAAVPTAIPAIADRDALLRIFYTTDGNYNKEPVLVKAYFGENEPLKATGPLLAASAEHDLGSTLNIAVPAAYLTQGASYRIEILQAASVSSGQNAAAAYPFEGQEVIPLSSSGAQLKLILVPIRYGADGSDRLPDTSEGQLQLYRDTFFGMYPVPQIQLEVHDPIQWNQAVKPTLQGWDALLSAMVDYRANAAATADQYFSGIFAPATSFAAYCQGTCATGLSPLAGPTDDWARVGIGVGFSGVNSVKTGVHEVAHAHGLNHAPCGTGLGVDPAFPYGDGGISIWGYNLSSNQLVDPAGHSDFMSYCKPTWVSDYHYVKLFDRLKLVNGAKLHVPDELMNRSYERISIAADGEASWLEPLKLRLPPLGESTTITLQTASTTKQVEGHYYPYSHGGGGLLLFSKTAASPVSARIQLDGKLRQLHRGR